MKEAGVGDWVTKRHRLTPDKVAVIFEEREWTYRELNERVNQAARMLLELGLVKGDRIAILANNCNAFLELFWACAKTGVVFVPLNTRLVSRELEYFLIQSTPEALFYGGEFSGMAGELKSLPGTGSVRNYICIDPPQDTTDGDYEAWIGRCPVEEPSVADPPTMEDPQVILFTSGTTGRAKGAILPHRKTLWNTLNNENAFDYIVSSVIYILNLPMFHSGGLFIATMPVIHKGGTLLIHRHFDPGQVLRDVERYRVTLLGGVPAMFQMIIAHPEFDRYDLSSLKGVALGAQITPRSVLEQIRDRFKVEAVGQVFGATETSVCITLTPDRPKDLEKVGSIGLPLFHGEVKVAGKTGEPVRPGSGEIGEICYRGPMTMLGYLNDPEKTRETIDPEGWFHYGDLATVDEDGYIFVVDRKTDMYISGGENVYPKEVENILIDHPKIMAIAIIPMPDEKWGECGLAIVNPYPGQSLTAGEVLEFGVGKVAKYKLPKEVIVTDKPIPQTATGKIYKYKLIEEYVKGRQRPYGG
jgi:fatty-acyl-CoA synthase